MVISDWWHAGRVNFQFQHAIIVGGSSGRCKTESQILMLMLLLSLLLQSYVHDSPKQQEQE